MSHFTVMVIGPDHEAQLAPYHEFECTGVADQYVVDVDITDEFRDVMADAEEDREDDQSALDYALEYYGFDDQVVADESEVDRDGEHKLGLVRGWRAMDWHAQAQAWCKGCARQPWTGLPRSKTRVC